MEYITGNDIKHFLANTPQITFEITECCNLACTYCGYGPLYNNKDPRKNRNLSEETGILFINYMVNLWEKGFLDITNDTIYIRSKFEKFKKHIFFSLTTNALLLNKYMDYFQKQKFHLLISLDGDRLGSSYRVYPNGNCAFDEIIKNVSTLKQTYPEYFKQYVEFNSVLNNRNSVDSITKFILDMFGKKPSISEINSIGIKSNKRASFNAMYQSKNKSFERPFKYANFLEDPRFDEVARYIQMRSDYFYLDYNELIFGKANRKRIPTGTCLPFTKKTFVSVLGKIMPCERIGYNYSLGKISDDGIELDFDDISNKYNVALTRAEKICRHCMDRKSCLCCLFNSGILSDCAVGCNYFVDNKAYEERRAQMLSFFREYPEAYDYIMKNYETV